jgi:hypothetical protein
MSEPVCRFLRALRRKTPREMRSMHEQEILLRRDNRLRCQLVKKNARVRAWRFNFIAQSAATNSDKASTITAALFSYSISQVSPSWEALAPWGPAWKFVEAESKG